MARLRRGCCGLAEHSAGRRLHRVATEKERSRSQNAPSTAAPALEGVIQGLKAVVLRGAFVLAGADVGQSNSAAPVTAAAPPIAVNSAPGSIVL